MRYFQRSSSRFTFLLIQCLVVVGIISGVHGQIKMNKGTPHVELSKPKQILRGSVLTSREGRPYYAFRGVRYANPVERFELPKTLDSPSASDDGVRDATKFAPSCARWSRWWKKYTGSEDCLYANIYVPMKVDDSLPLPVMLWIHGGAFIDGESETFGADYFMDENVILVTINYRLGAFGFLSTGDEVVPGNMALHDQAMAIKFIHKNVEHFGGDKNRITIFGESAGAASVGLQLLYLKNKGKVNAAISQSGSVHCNWIPQDAKQARRNLHQLSKSVGCDPKTNSSELVQCLKSKQWEDILDAQRKLPSMIPFGVVIEPKQDVKRSFLTQHPQYLVNMAKFIKVPYILGVNEEEGHFISSAATLLNKKLTEELNNEWERIAPNMFMLPKLKDPSTSDLVASKIREFYLDDREIAENTRQEFTDFNSDAYFNYGVYKTAKAMKNEGGNVFTYVFTYKVEFSLLQTWLGIHDLHVVTHADELQYLFDATIYGPAKPHEKGSESERISKNLVKLWSSFASKGTPQSTWGNATYWHPLSKYRDMFWYQLDSETQVLESYNKERFEFWDKLMEEYFVDEAAYKKKDQGTKKTKDEL